MIERGIQLGPLTFHWYGAILGMAVVVGASIASNYAGKFKIQNSRFKFNKDDVWNALIWAVVFGVVGARIYHVVSEWQYYLINPGEVLAVWNGGLGIFGGILGGVVGLWGWINKKYKKYKRYEKYKRLAELLDVGAFGLPVAQAIGRLGNFVNQELYGKPLDFVQDKLPFYALYVAPNSRLPGYEQFSYYQPLFVYEAVLNLVVWGLLVYLAKKKVFKPGGGKYFAVYLFGYSMVRFWLEPLRIEVWKTGGVPVAQLVGVGLMIVSLMWLVIKPEEVK